MDLSNSLVSCSSVIMELLEQLGMHVRQGPLVPIDPRMAVPPNLIRALL